MQKSSPDLERKQYQAPKLRVYGDICELTQLNNMGAGMQDNKVFGMFKT